MQKSAKVLLNAGDTDGAAIRAYYAMGLVVVTDWRLLWYIRILSILVLYKAL
jgi:hypothetical protein